MQELYSKEQIKYNIGIVLNLEYLGVHIEKINDNLENYIVMFSVPEMSTLETDNENVNKFNKTSDNLIKLSKKWLIDMLIKSCKDIYDDEDFINELKEKQSDYFKFYAKVRKGEIWTKEIAENRIKELNNEFDKISGYKEV